MIAPSRGFSAVTLACPVLRPELEMIRGYMSADQQVIAGGVVSMRIVAFQHVVIFGCAAQVVAIGAQRK